MVEIITCESGDWTILKHKDFKVANHHISIDDWVELLEKLNIHVDIKTISDDDMEMLYWEEDE